MNMTKLLILILLIFLGAFIIFFGGMDDSPGAQGIGLIAIIVGVIGIIRTRKKSSK